MFTTLSFGGGQDSTLLALLAIHERTFRERYIPGELLVIMSDTGNEFPETHRNRQTIQALCSKAGIQFEFITPGRGYHSEAWQSLKGQYRRNNTIGSKAYPKSCTDNLKIKPIYNFLEHELAYRYGFVGGRKKGFYQYAERFGRLRMIIGIAAGEESRMAPDSGPVWMQKCVERVYPLVDLGYDRKKCQELIAGYGIQVPVPSNCMICPYMSLVELLYLERFYPEEYVEWVQLEQNKISANLHQGGKNHGVWGKMLLPEALVEAKLKHGYMTNEQLAEYRFSHGHCVKSKY